MACKEARSWQKLAPYPIQVAANMSGVQFARESKGGFQALSNETGFISAPKT
jgi:hypothetical protein